MWNGKQQQQPKTGIIGIGLIVIRFVMWHYIFDFDRKSFSVSFGFLQ